MDEGTWDPYKFESPDAIADTMDDRKRKRRKILQDELTWNRGLQLWLERRDLWTGAVPSIRKSSHQSNTMEGSQVASMKELPEPASVLNNSSSSSLSTSQGLSSQLESATAQSSATDPSIHSPAKDTTTHTLPPPIQIATPRMTSSSRSSRPLSPPPTPSAPPSAPTCTPKSTPRS